MAKETTWGTIYRRRLAKGEDHGSAAYAADQWEARNNKKAIKAAETELQQRIEFKAYQHVYRQLIDWCDAVDEDIDKMAGDDADNAFCRGRAHENKRVRQYFGDWLKEQFEGKG